MTIPVNLCLDLGGEDVQVTIPPRSQPISSHATPFVSTGRYTADVWRSKRCKNPRAQNEGSAHKMSDRAHKTGLNDRGSAHRTSDRAHKMTGSAHNSYFMRTKDVGA